MQTYLARHIAKQVSANLNAKFEVGRVDIAFFNRVILRDIHIEDQQGDTLLEAGRLVATVNYINRSSRNIHFNRISLQNALINLRSDADSVLNARFITEALTSGDTLRNKWNFVINAVNLENSTFTYRNVASDNREHGIDFRDIEVTGLNLLANKIHTTTDSLHFNIRYLYFHEKSGFTLNHFSSINSISPSGMEIKDLMIATPRSRINLELFQMNYNGFDAFNDFVSRVSIISRFRPSSADMRDIAYFAPRLGHIDMKFLLSGEVTGRINNLKGNGVNIHGLEETSLTADFNMVGLPGIGETFIFLDLHEFNSSAREMVRLVSPLTGDKNVKGQIPLDLSVLGKISYEGKFTGFIDDFVAYGELKTDLGTIASDIMLVPGAGNLLNLNGKLKAMDFDAGSLAGSEQVGRISFSAGLDGQISSMTGIDATLEGIIDSVFLLDYNYENILFSGRLADKKFEGAANINDPNIELSFLGSFDLSREINLFDFSADVTGARMHELKLASNDPSLILSFNSRANFTGNDFDNIDGEIELSGIVFERGDHILKIDTTTLLANGSGTHRLLAIDSDLAEARIEGNYEFSTIARSFNRFVSHYLPSYHKFHDSYDKVTGNNFKISVQLKEVSGFTEFFFPEISIAPATRIEGTYDPTAYNTSINGHTEELRVGNHRFRNIAFDTRSNDSLFTISSRAEHLSLGNRFELENIDLYSGLVNDSISFAAKWDNRDNKRYKGDISVSMSFDQNHQKKRPAINLDIRPSQITIADSVWSIEPARIRLDSTSYQVHNFVFGRNDQHIKLHGNLSESRHDSLHIDFQNLNLNDTELVTMPDNFQIAGFINGNASISDIHENPVFTTDIRVKEMHLNRQDFGDLSIISQWNPLERNIHIHTFSDRDDDRLINIAGYYTPESNLLDFDISLAKINLRTFDGYLDEVFASLRGLAGGSLALTGNLREPVFNGNLYLEKASFTVDYLNTRYNFTHDATVTNNNIVFRDMLIYDQQHNTCRANGTVSHKNFRDFNLDIYLYPERFMALNTTARDNEMFYGRVMASGLVHVVGPTDNLTMNISARTDRNTRFFIPIQKNSEIDDLHFLTFRSPSPGAEEETGDDDQYGRNYQSAMAGIQLSLDLDVTPDAEVQIIFDSKIGDIIRGSGSGSFKMDINTTGEFSMLGEYIIEQGDYLFTLQNVINKRFDIERGSRIYWSGDPYDANVDLRAVYRLRTSPGRLLPAYNGGDERLTRRIPVECQIIMKEKLMTPEIGFGIELPTADPEIRQRVHGILNTEEKINEQFLALLVINSFLPDQDMAGMQGRRSGFGTSATDASITTVSEFFSNQLSNWLSQLSRDVDFGINWRPGDELSHDEVELAMSTQVFNDRVSINGHVDVGGRQTNTSNIVGDFDVDIKLNRSGKLRLKAFTRANDDLVRLDLSPYTQGVGLFYREDFNSFDELVSRYWKRVFPPASDENE